MGWYEKIVAVLPVGESASAAELARRIGDDGSHCGAIVHALRMGVKYDTIRRVGREGKYIIWERLE